MANSFAIGAKIHSIENNFGDGLILGYRITPKIEVNTSINRAYLNELNNNSVYQTASYNFYRLGVKYSFNPNQIISPIITSGAEMIQTNTSVATTDDIIWGSYTTFGIDMNLTPSGNLRSSIQLGTSGKGSKATNFLGSPSYGHGFNLIAEVNYYF
jgi:hypothetical protein